MIPRFLRCLGILFTLGVLAGAAPPKEKPDEPVILDPFVVTGKSRGIIPLNGWFRCSLLTGDLKTPVNITGTLHSEKTLENYTVAKGEQIIAVDGQRVVGMDRHAIIRLWMETGEAGDPVKLTIRGTAENSSVFREITLKRIAPAKRPVR